MAETISHSLYNGEVTVDFYPNSHRYKVEWEWCQSVTTKLWVLNKRLEQWAVNQWIDYLKTVECTDDALEKARYKWTEKKDNAAKTGTGVHDLIEEYVSWLIKGEETKEPFLIDEEDISCWSAFKKFLLREPKFIASELVTYSREYKYVGKFDAIYELDWKIYLCDFKTSSGIYKEYILQCMAYVQALEEEGKYKFDGISIIRLSKQNSELEVFELVDRDKLEEARQAFISLSQFSDIYSKIDKWLK